MNNSDNPVPPANGPQQELIFNHSSDPTFLIGVEKNGRYRFITVNTAFLHISKLTREQVEGKYADEIIPANLQLRIFGWYAQAIKERQSLQWEDTADYPDGRKTIIVSITPVCNEDGVYTILVGTLHDITDRKQAEENLKSKEKQLELIYNTVSDIIFMLSVEEGSRYRFTSVNNAFLSLTGLSREQVEGKYVGEVIPESSLATALSQYSKAIQERSKCEWEETLEYPAGIKTGIISITPVFNDKGECNVLVGTIHDITEIKKAQKEKDRITHSLNERVKELTTVYRVDQLLKSTDQSVEQVLQSFVSLLPAGWQYPEITEARISLENQQFETAGFGSAVESQSADFSIPDGRTGKIEVAYTATTPQETEGPFLSEERDMINLLAEMLRIYLARKEETAQLQKERKLSESIMNSMPGIFYLFDINGHYLLWNKNHETVTGYSAEEMKKMHPLDFFDGAEKEMIEEKIGNVFKNGYADVEATFITRDGKRVPYFFNGIAITFNDQPCIMGVGLDITVRKKMETGLRDAEIKFRTLVEKSQVGVYIVQNGKFVYVNPRFAEIFGYSQEELVGEDPVQKVISSEDQATVSENIRARMNNEVETVHYEVNGKKKDATTNRIELFGSRTVYEGQPTIIGTMVDITERRHAQEALKKSEANLKTIFDNTDTIYVLLDTDFQIISFNQRAADFASKEFHKPYDISKNLLDFVADERKSDLHALMKKVVSGEPVQYENSYLQPDGTVNWYYARIYPIRDSAENIFGLMFAVSDITEKKLLEQEIVDRKVQEQKKMIRAVLNGQEKERNKIGQELHDNVNQILAGAKMYLGYLKDKTPEQEETIQESIDLLDSAIDEIRSLTREQVTPQRKIDLKDHIQSLVDNLNTHSSVQTIFTYDTGEYYINEELKINIYRIVQEGINNILKHSGATTVAINVKADKSGLHILIDDNGKGFSTSVPQKKGTGITNILNRAESYNGIVKIESTPGQGCKIAITTPL